MVSRGVLIFAAAVALLLGSVAFHDASHKASQEVELAVSPTVQKHLDAVKKATGGTPPKGVRKPLEAIADLLAKEQMYEELRGAVPFDKRGREQTGFAEWKKIISNPKIKSAVEYDVREKMTDPNGKYSTSIRSTLRKKYRTLLPALAREVSHEATSKEFDRLRNQMVAAGEWDKGYLPQGNNLAGNPLRFGGKYIGNKAKLGKSCHHACTQHDACRGFTYNPSQGVCYLKTTASPVRGVDCKEDCWYWGKVIGHPYEMSLSLQDAEKDLGLKVTDLKVGTGETIKKGDTAVIGYVGKLQDGTIFDQGQYTFQFGAGQVIKGDDLGLQGMKVGGRRKLVMPPSLAYGRQGYGSLIPPNSVLDFTVSLKSLSHSGIASGYKNSNTP